MHRFQRPPPLPKSPRSSFLQRSPITLRRRPYRCWRSPCRILRSTGKYSWNFRWGLKMKNAGPAPREGWRVGRQTALLTRSAIVSDGTQSDTGQSCWALHSPFPMNFANSPKRTCRRLHPVISTIVMLRLFARRQRTSMSAYFTNSLTPPTGLGLLASPRGRQIPVGQRVARSFLERWPADLPRDISLPVQGHQLARRGGAAWSLPLLIGGGN